MRDIAVDAFGTAAVANAADVHHVVHLLKHSDSTVQDAAKRAIVAIGHATGPRGALLWRVAGKQERMFGGLSSRCGS